LVKKTGACSSCGTVARIVKTLCNRCYQRKAYHENQSVAARAGRRGSDTRTLYVQEIVRVRSRGWGCRA
jgi:Fe-S cluster biogenesis protein NfuA